MIEKTRHEGDVEMQLDELYEDARPGTFLLGVDKLARRLAREGHSREELLEIFERYRSVLRDRGEEDLEDDLLDVMDRLDGWCAGHVRI